MYGQLYVPQVIMKCELSWSKREMKKVLKNLHTRVASLLLSCIQQMF